MTYRGTTLKVDEKILDGEARVGRLLDFIAVLVRRHKAYICGREGAWGWATHQAHIASKTIRGQT